MLAAIAVMSPSKACGVSFAVKVVVLCWDYVFWGVFSVCVFGHSALQPFKCVCVERGHSVHTQSSLSIFTTLGTAVLSSLHSGVVLS